MTWALTFEGLTVAAVGLVGDELRLCCTVPVVIMCARYRISWRCTAIQRMRKRQSSRRALFCGVCEPREDPVEIPELK